MKFRAGQHLRRNDDFRAVREQGRRIDCGAFLLTWRKRPAESDAALARVGFVASRASVGDAVHRNLAKRRLREIFRHHQTLVPSGLDLVLTARPALLRMEFAESQLRFANACRKLAPAASPPNV